jgi:hypothetical protein
VWNYNVRESYAAGDHQARRKQLSSSSTFGSRVHAPDADKKAVIPAQAGIQCLSFFGRYLKQQRR